jgi:hypothetical protein
MLPGDGFQESGFALPTKAINRGAISISEQDLHHFHSFCAVMVQ